MPEQAISSGYITKKALVELLGELFGSDWGATVRDFATSAERLLTTILQLSRDTWILDIPRKLTEVGVIRP